MASRIAAIAGARLSLLFDDVRERERPMTGADVREAVLRVLRYAVGPKMRLATLRQKAIAAQRGEPIPSLVPETPPAPAAAPPAARPVPSGVARQVSPRVDPEAVPPVSLRVSQLAAEWIAGASERSGWTPKTKDCIEAGLGLVTELLGDPPIREVDYAAAAKAVAALRRTPKNRTQRGLRGVPVAELCARVERGELEPLSDVTVRNILGRCSPFWSWAVRRDHCAKHWFEGAYKARKTVRDEDARQPFTPDELRAAFRTFRTVDDDFRWFPVCLLYSGLRTGELAQLTPQDVREVDGVPCIDVNVRGGKSVKTPGAVRLVPVHPVLIRLGLLQHARQMKEEGEQRLFRLPMGREPSTAASKRWQNLRRRLGVKASLHAARHSFSTQLHKAGVSLDDIASLVGHVRGAGLETARYAKRPSPAALLKIIERLRYPVGEPE